MSPRGGSLVALAFAFVWLWVGAGALAMPWKAVALVVGATVLGFVGWRVLARPITLGNVGRFHGRRFALAVIFEFAAAGVVGNWLVQNKLEAYLWPALGVIVALHFIGLWWASGDTKYLTLTALMLAANVVAILTGPGGPAMLAICGFGSSAALAHAVGRR